ncbi:MAG: hypothetical protein QG670_1638 [Thermoproteota archaeon]|nr:hypothetical protein [Thermoproteota archaeon]
MPRDIWGNIIRIDIFGRKKTKREVKREVLTENRMRGRTAEDNYRMNAAFRGVEVERAPHGRDFIERRRDLWTGRVTRTTHIEIKSSSTAPLTKLQQKTKRRKSNYRVIRQDPGFY